jgi:hypothetical protein
LSIGRPWRCRLRCPPCGGGDEGVVVGGNEGGVDGVSVGLDECGYVFGNEWVNEGDNVGMDDGNDDDCDVVRR